MSEPYDPRRSVSPELTEVRTVLSRAKSALKIIDHLPEYARHYHQGHDKELMREALLKTIELLEPWERVNNRSGRGGRSV